MEVLAHMPVFSLLNTLAKHDGWWLWKMGAVVELARSEDSPWASQSVDYMASQSAESYRSGQ